MATEDCGEFRRYGYASRCMVLLSVKRRGRDSNPRYRGYPHNGFRARHGMQRILDEQLSRGPASAAAASQARACASIDGGMLPTT